LQATGCIQIKTDRGPLIPFQDGFSGRINSCKAVFKGPPYDDKEEDQEMIKEGFRYYKEIYAEKVMNRHRGKRDAAIHRAGC
jgi:hypothetical protein